MRVLVLGGTGMLGHKLWQVLADRFDAYVTVRRGFDSYTRYKLFDPARAISHVSVENFDSIVRAIATVRPKLVVNCIGIVKQAAAAKDPLITISVNALFPHRLAQLCQAAGSRLIHISTDCVFSGRKGNYSESDVADAEDLYGRTKYLGEVSYDGCLTLRTSMIGRLFPVKEKFWRAAKVTLVAAIVFCAVYFILYLSTGFNIINCLITAVGLDGKPPSYSLRWYIGTRLEDLLDFATLSGVAAAGLWSGIAIKLATSRNLRARFDPTLSISILSCSLVIVLMVSAGLNWTGETGRTWLFLLPFVLIPSVGFLHSRSYRDIFHDPVFQLVILSFCQTLIFEAVLDTWW